MKRWLLRILGGGLAVIVLYTGFVLVAWRDIEPADYEAAWWDGPTPGTASIDGVDLRYADQGQGPPVLLLHSHFFTMRMWDPVAERLHDRFRVIRFDMTSHGLTGPDPSGDYGMERSLQLIEGLLDHLGIERAHLVGSSLGGNMAFHFAARHPERVDRLVLVNSGGQQRENSRGGGEIPGWADTAFRLLPRMLYRTFLEWMILDDSLVTDALVAEFHDGFRRAGNRPAEMERLRDFNVGDPVPVLARVEAPTLVMWGRDNPQLPFELADRFAEQLTAAPEVTVDIVPGAGHVLPLERPDYTAARLRGFLVGESDPLRDWPGYRRGELRVLQGPPVTLTHDDGRTLEAQAWYPAAQGPFPVIAFSHGFAADKAQYHNLIEHWVSHGYVVVAGDHEDSGGTVSAILASLRLGEMSLIDTRVQDMRLLLENLEVLLPDPVERWVDGEWRLAAGHSFGAFIAQVMMGARAIDPETGDEIVYTGPEVQGAVAISPPGEMFDVIVAESWTTQRGPVFMTTGTADVDGRFFTDWRQHLLSFEQAQAGGQSALVIEGADHYLGKLICRLDEDVPAQHGALGLVNLASTSFLNGLTRKDTTALQLLSGGNLETMSPEVAEWRTR